MRGAHEPLTVFCARKRAQARRRYSALAQGRRLDVLVITYEGDMDSESAAILRRLEAARAAALPAADDGVPIATLIGRACVQIEMKLRDQYAAMCQAAPAAPASADPPQGRQERRERARPDPAAAPAGLADADRARTGAGARTQSLLGLPHGGTAGGGGPGPPPTRAAAPPALGNPTIGHLPQCRMALQVAGMGSQARAEGAGAGALQGEAAEQAVAHARPGMIEASAVDALLATLEQEGAPGPGRLLLLGDEAGARAHGGVGRTG